MRASIALGKINPAACAGAGWTADAYLMVDGKKAELSWDDADVIAKEFKHLGAKRVPGMGVKISLEQARKILTP